MCRLIREALGDLASPCPLVDFTAFGQLMNNALNRTFNPPFDPYLNDVNLVLAIWTLEEIGSTGDKVRGAPSLRQPTSTEFARLVL